MVLLQPQSVLISMAPVSTKSSEERNAQSWPRLSLTSALGRTWPAPHQQHHPGEWVLLFPRTELCLLTEVQVRWPWLCKNGRASPVWKEQGRTIPLAPHPFSLLLLQAEQIRALTSYSIQEAVPASSLGSTIELTLLT